MSDKPFMFVKCMAKSFGDGSHYERGWGNGYVAIPKGCNMYGIEYDEIDVHVHGGLTYSDETTLLDPSMPVGSKPTEYWVIGFDTAHYNDTINNWTKEAVIKEAESLLEQVIKIIENGT